MEAELAIHRRVSDLLGKVVPKRRFEAIAMAAEGHPVQVAVRVLGVSESGFYAWRDRGPSARAIRHVLLTDTIRQFHAAFSGVYEVRRVHTELTLGRGMRL